jgi:hypothetical protein
MICIEFVTINSWPPMTLHSITSNWIEVSIR